MPFIKSSPILGSARHVRAVAVLVAAAGACLFGAQSASAAASCSYSVTPAPASMVVTMTAPGDEAVLTPDVTHMLLLNGNSCFGVSGVAMTNTVDRIVVNDISAGGTSVRIERPAAFAPGATLEDGPLNSSEIEFELNLGTGNDHLTLRGSDTPDVFTFGSDGVNTGAGPLDFDREITGTGIDEITAQGSLNADEISGQGGRGTGAPAQLPMHLHGGKGDDILAGGDSADDVHGDEDGDELEGGLGNDELDGGANGDAVTYAHAAAGVHVALDSSQQLQQTGAAGADHLLGFETLVGSAHGDDLRVAVGDAEVDGGAGDDRLTGSSTTETLYGGDGDDRIDPGPETTVHDTVIGGTGFDTVTYARAPKAVSVDLAAGVSAPRDGIGPGDQLESINAIEGSPFADLLAGDGGVNTIDGLAGTDEIKALAGADLVRARDGAADSVDCGDGDDSAVADIATLDSLVACESADVVADPATGVDPQQPPAGGAAADTTLRLSLTARRAQRLLGRRALVATVVCAGEPCRVRASGRLGTMRLRSVTRSVAGDTRTRLRVPLSSKVLHRIGDALEDGRHPRVTLSVRATDAAGNTVLRKRSIRARQP